MWKVCIAWRISPARNFDAFYIFTCIKFSKSPARNFQTFQSGLFLSTSGKLICKQQVTIMGVPGRGAEGAAAPPSLLGKQSQSGNIRFTVGQYWLIIKINGTNSVNFVGNSVNLWEICYLIGIFCNHSSPPPPPASFTTILESFSWKFFLTTKAQSEKVGQISFRPPNFFLTVRPWLLCKQHGANHKIQSCLFLFDFICSSWRSLFKWCWWLFL